VVEATKRLRHLNKHVLSAAYPGHVSTAVQTISPCRSGEVFGEEADDATVPSKLLRSTVYVRWLTHFRYRRAAESYTASATALWSRKPDFERMPTTNEMTKERPVYEGTNFIISPHSVPDCGRAQWPPRAGTELSKDLV